MVYSWNDINDWIINKKKLNKVVKKYENNLLQFHEVDIEGQVAYENTERGPEAFQKLSVLGRQANYSEMLV